MANPNNIEKHKFKKGVSGNPKGHPKGKRNRSTIAKIVLEMTAKYPDAVFEKLKKQYPELQKSMTIEEMMTIVIANKAITKQDVAAYEKIMDSAFGKAKQDMDVTSGGKSLVPFSVVTKDEETKKALQNLR